MRLFWLFMLIVQTVLGFAGWWFAPWPWDLASLVFAIICLLVLTMIAGAVASDVVLDSIHESFLEPSPFTPPRS